MKSSIEDQVYSPAEIVPKIFDRSSMGKIPQPDGNKGARGAQRGELLNFFLGRSYASVSTAASLLRRIRLPRLRLPVCLLTLKTQFAERPGRRGILPFIQ